MFFFRRLVSVFEVEFVSFPHQSSDSAVDPGLFDFIFGFLCGINLLMARSSSEVMFFHS